MTTIHHITYASQEIAKVWGMNFKEPYIIVKNVKDPSNTDLIHRILSVYHKIVSIPVPASQLTPQQALLHEVAWGEYSLLSIDSGIMIELTSEPPKGAKKDEAKVFDTSKLYDE